MAFKHGQERRPLFRRGIQTVRDAAVDLGHGGMIISVAWKIKQKKPVMNKLYHCVFALNYHLVVCTKYRRRCLTEAMLNTMHRITTERCAGWGGSVEEFNGEVDHVHMLISMPPNLDLSRFVNNLKTTTSRLLRQDFAEHLNRFYRKPVLWSRSYCVVSCGGAPLSVIKQYIEQQARPN